jgi:hypothetical protein
LSLSGIHNLSVSWTSTLKHGMTFSSLSATLSKHRNLGSKIKILCK